MLCCLPTPIVFQQERSSMRQKLERNTRQHFRDLVNWLTDIKLKVKEGTHSTFLRIKVNVTWIVPICVTVTLSQFRQLDKSGNRTSDFGKQSDGMNDMACGPNVKNPSFNIKGSLVRRINSKKNRILPSQTFRFLERITRNTWKIIRIDGKISCVHSIIISKLKGMRILHGC